MEKFYDRHAAGKALAKQLMRYAKKKAVIVLALPRGGVPVAYEIATALDVSLDILVVRKLGVPWHEELAMGAIAGNGHVVFNQSVIDDLNISRAMIDEVIQAELKELQRREKVYRGERLFPVLADKTIILVDDGIATGATMRAAIATLKLQKPTKIIVAVPVASAAACEEIAKEVDEFICLLRPDHFLSVGAWYVDFSQTTDEEVYALLARIEM